MRLFDGPNNNNKEESREKKGDKDGTSDNESVTSNNDSSYSNSSSPSSSISLNAGNINNNKERIKIRRTSSGNRPGNKTTNINGITNGYTNTTTTSPSKKDATFTNKTKGKKFPSTPYPPPIQDTTEESSTSAAVLTPTVTFAGGDVRSRLGSDDLVDYEDFGSSSSSDSEKVGKSDINFYQETTTSSSNKTTFDNSSGANSFSTTSNNKSYIHTPKREEYEFYESSSGYSNNSNSNNNNMDLDNAPCSSSSLRERLNSQRSGSKVTSKTSDSQSVVMIPLYEDELDANGESRDIKNEDSQPPRPSSMISDECESLNNLPNPTDKYIYSGVGRHFGRKRNSSLSNLGGFGADGESLDGSSIDFGKSGGHNKNIGGVDSDFNLSGYCLRLKTAALIFFSTLLILSLSSLLFVFPIIVDPILLGLGAEFSLEPVLCRTVSVRHGKGPIECSIVPSCRAGCTADIFNCTFVDVEYTYDSRLITSKSDINNSLILQDYQNETTYITKNGTLYININGCGYPPQVNCSVFYQNYGVVGKEFKCFFSVRNESIVVPYYNYGEERHHLRLAILVPFGLALGSALILILLLKGWNIFNFNCGKKLLVVNKSSSQLKLIDKQDTDSLGNVVGESLSTKSKKWKKRKDNANKINGNAGGKTTLIVDESEPHMNGTVSKANGHAFLQDTISGLMGMKSPSDIHQTIKTLHHQHDNFDKATHLNGTPQQQRKPRYAKKHEMAKGTPPTSSKNEENNLFSKSNKAKEFAEDTL